MDTIQEERSSEVAAALADLTLDPPRDDPEASPEEEGAMAIPRDDATSPSDEEEDPLNETILPVRGNRGLSRREDRAMHKAWKALRDRIDGDLKLVERAEVAVDTATCELRAFMREYGAEGRNLVGGYRRRVALAMGRRNAAKAWQAAEEERQKKRFAVERRIMALRERAYKFADTTRAEAEALQKELNELRDKDPAKVKPSSAYQCPMCKLSGVRRGDECPNVLEHRRS